MKKYTVYVNGIHCKACKFLIEDLLNDDKNILSKSVNLKSGELSFETDLELSDDEILERINFKLFPHNYSASFEKVVVPKKSGDLFVAFSVSILVLISFFVLQKSGILSFGLGEKLTPNVALFVGVIASFSTCLAVVGGLILSLSAKVSQDASTFKPFMFFHVGRILGFAFLGGLLGLLGGVISINTGVSAVLGLLVSVIMIILGVNLLGVFESTKSLQVTFSSRIFNSLHRLENGFFAPFLTGALTFFLPCGFTQSMQFAALSSGSFFGGMSIMLMFVLGTLPMLLLISFTSFKFAHTKYASLFFKVAGFIVIGLGFFAFMAGLAALGIINPLFNI
ncbi:hypothetical protein COU74_04535 [Candidatus Peregrinibacteria bacterium CG10_big_fil_rev_8_21_14_0_10_36_19]|nr:MAG: hypothetical protein COU74_04535 [Candidatus Peregrinibacteria bacterium CG10_big_fil_rev_8_21_14_0_10_36_19]